MEKATNVQFPKWAIILYSVLAIILIPWVFNLAQNLPTHHLVRHWDAMWVGFDIIMLITMAITICFVIKGRIWVIISATALGTLFIVDAWFDVLTARPGKDQNESLFFGALEIVLAILTFRFVYIVMVHSAKQKKLNIINED